MKTVSIVTFSVVGTLVALAVGAGLFAVSGLYDIAADAPHSRPVYALLETLRERSVAARAGRVQVPDLDDPAMLAEGAEHYAAMCSGCHLAPGMQESDSEIRPGLYPRPPDLARQGIGDPRAAFWIIKHGIKMSGMPAWGTTHGDAAIWNMVALLRKLPGMSAQQFQTLAGDAAAGAVGHAHGHHHHEHADADHGEDGHAEHAHEDHAQQHDGP